MTGIYFSHESTVWAGLSGDKRVSASAGMTPAPAAGAAGGLVGHLLAVFSGTRDPFHRASPARRPQGCQGSYWVAGGSTRPKQSHKSLLTYPAILCKVQTSVRTSLDWRGGESNPQILMADVPEDMWPSFTPPCLYPQLGVFTTTLEICLCAHGSGARQGTHG